MKSGGKNRFVNGVIKRSDRLQLSFLEVGPAEVDQCAQSNDELTAGQRRLSPEPVKHLPDRMF